MYQFDRYYRHERFFILLDKVKARPLQWLVLAVIVAIIDFLSGPDVQFPILFILPIAVASWFGKRKQALLLSVILPCTRIYFFAFWGMPWLAVGVLSNVLIRIIIFISFAYLISFAKELHILRGLLVVCNICGRIRNEHGNWNTFQEYIVNHSEAIFSHGVCPECKPELFK